jgi:hypothetical protein
MAGIDVRRILERTDLATGLTQCALERARKCFDDISGPHWMKDDCATHTKTPALFLFVPLDGNTARRQEWDKARFPY